MRYGKRLRRLSASSGLSRSGSGYPVLCSYHLLVIWCPASIDVQVLGGVRRQLQPGERVDHVMDPTLRLRAEHGLKVSDRTGPSPASGIATRRTDSISLKVSSLARSRTTSPRIRSKRRMWLPSALQSSAMSVGWGEGVSGDAVVANAAELVGARPVNSLRGRSASWWRAEFAARLEPQNSSPLKGGLEVGHRGPACFF